MKTLLFILWAAAAFIPAPAWAMAKMPQLPSSGIVSEREQKPLTLEDCYQLALKQSEMLAMKQADIEKTWADFLAASGDLIGDGRFIMTDSFIEPQGGSSSSDSGATANAFRTERREKKFVISQPLFQGLREVAAVAGAGHLRKQREGEAQRARQVLFTEVVEAFYAVLTTEHDLEITQTILALYEERLQDLAMREKIGKSRASEAINARSRMKAVEADAADMRGVLAFQRRLLEFLTGIALENHFLKETDGENLPDPDDLDNYLSSAGRRADVRAAYHASRVGFQNVVSAQSDFWPEISLDSSLYEQREGFQSGIDWDLLFTINVPLWTGGTNLGAVKAAIADWKKSKLGFSETQRRAQLQVKQSHGLWAAAIDRYKAFDDSVRAAEENYRFQTDDYKNNLVSNLDVLDALQGLSDARRDRNRAYYDARANYWRLKAAAGECCESI